MKVILSLLLSTITSLSFAQRPNAQSGKQLIDSSVFGKWPSVGDGQISNDGNYALYNIDKIPLGGNTLVFQSTSRNWKREFIGASQGQFTQDSKWGIFKLQGDSLCLLELSKDNNQRYIPHTRSFALSGNWLAYQTNESNTKSELVLRNLSKETEESFEDIVDFSFDPSGHGLLFQTAEGKDSTKMYTLHWLDLNRGTNSVIWNGKTAANSYVFDMNGQQVVFAAVDAIFEDSEAVWYYNRGMKTARIQINKNTPGINDKFMIGSGSAVFSKDGKRIFFLLIEKEIPKASKGAINVDIWSYTDKRLQSEQLQFHGYEKESFAATMAIDSPQVIQLETENEKICTFSNQLNESNKYFIVTAGGGTDFWWQKSGRPWVYLVNAENGSQKLLKRSVPYYLNRGLAFKLSPNEKYVIYYDPEQRNYFSYNIANNIISNITMGMAINWRDESSDNPGIAQSYPVGIAGWTPGDKGVLINDNYDIWLLDLAGIQKPVNITNGYGRLHHIKFRLGRPGDETPENISMDAPILMTAFNPVTGYRGFYRKTKAKGNPELLTMGPYNWGTSLPQKAKDTDVWLVNRMSAIEAPNYYISHDLQNWHAISDLQPEKNYNWLTSELMSWKLPDGTTSQGILYKPENFDPKKHYPLLLNYYERKSDRLNNYLEPVASRDEINIPYFVSRGYLVFLPDIHYKIGYTGESVLNAILSAAKCLAQKPWVDSKRMGIQGHSFGGYETNYVVTHSPLFAAAVESCGPGNLMSLYGSVKGFGSSSQLLMEVDQIKIGATPWERPDLYIDNSPVFKADRVTTPLLMMANKDDGSVPFAQGVEFFTDLRRLGKKVWMLQYDVGGHGVYGKDALDYTIRMEQFFNHYLKNAPPPRWMTEGIPARLKGIDTGLELDLSGKKP